MHTTEDSAWVHLYKVQNKQNSFIVWEVSTATVFEDEQGAAIGKGNEEF